MKLSFKKSILLFSTIALGTMLGAAQDAETNEIALVQGYTFEREWKSEVVPKWADIRPWSFARQGFGQNDHFLIQNHNEGEEEIQIYGRTGKVGVFATNTGLGSNFTKDDAGNMIVRATKYNREFEIGEEIYLIKADGSTRTTVYLPDDCPEEERGDYWGFAEGDIFSAEGGKLMMCATDVDYIYLLVFKNGEIAETHHVVCNIPINETQPERNTFYNNDIVSSWTDANGKKHFLLDHYGEKPIDMILDESNWTVSATRINTWSYNGNNGYGISIGTNAFSFNGKNYIMFSARPNWNDGFIIAELGTNADGTLNGEINVVAQHLNDYKEPMNQDASPQCNWLNWEPKDEKSVYIYQYFPGFYMARYILSIKTDETTLDYIVNEGTVDETYTIADDILGVYIAEKEPKRVYAKDYGKHRDPSKIKEGEVDFVMDQVDENGIKLQQDEWDQSNWVILDFETAEEAQKFAGKIGETNHVSPIACKVIKGGTLTGTLTNKLNPTMTVTSYVEPTETLDYLQNSYIPCNFMTPNVQSNIFWHGSTYNFFFVKPKPQEYVKVWWALFDDGLKHFSIVTDSEAKGSFNVDWSLYPGDWKVDFIKDNAYNFHAIVRYVEGEGDGTIDGVVEGNYMVFPLEGGDGLITAIDAVAAADSEVQSVTYVNLLGVQSATPFAGINLVVTRYTTGETIVTKQIK